MTTAADDQMGEQAFEAYLAGRAVPCGAGGIAAFADAVRATATRPGRPSAALAELLATGLLPDQRAVSAAPRQTGARRRRRLPVFLTALIAKLAAAGAIAQAATGAAVVVIGVSTVGLAGALPDSAQHTFATVVEAVSPLHVTDPTATTGSTTPTGGTATGTGDAATPSPTTTSTQVTTQTTTPPTNFGQQIAGKVEAGKVDGVRVSDLAHAKKTAAPTGTTTTTTGVTATPTKTDDDDADEQEKATTASRTQASTSAAHTTESGRGSGQHR